MLGEEVGFQSQFEDADDSAVSWIDRGSSFHHMGTYRKEPYLFFLITNSFTVTKNTQASKQKKIANYLAFTLNEHHTSAII